MGRSQVAYNRRHGRPGGKGGGRGSGGRGGGRGRGEGRAAPSKGAAAAEALGSNAWRYEREKVTTETDEEGGGEREDDDYKNESEEWDDAAAAAGGSGGGDFTDGNYYGEYGSASHDVASALADPVTAAGDPFDVGDAGGGGGGPSLSLDLNALSRSLSRLPVGERLRLPSHVAEAWEEKYGPGGRMAGSRKTVSELRVMGSTSAFPVKEADKTEEIAAAPNVELTDDAGTKAMVDDDRLNAGDGDGDGDGDVDGDGDDEDEDGEEDLDAWLDSVIS